MLELFFPPSYGCIDRCATKTEKVNYVWLTTFSSLAKYVPIYPVWTFFLFSRWFWLTGKIAYPPTTYSRRVHQQNRRNRRCGEGGHCVFKWGFSLLHIFRPSYGPVIASKLSVWTECDLLGTSFWSASNRFKIENLMRQEIEFLKRSVEFASSEKEPGQQGNEN